MCNCQKARFEGATKFPYGFEGIKLSDYKVPQPNYLALPYRPGYARFAPERPSDPEPNERGIKDVLIDIGGQKQTLSGSGDKPKAPEEEPERSYTWIIVLGIAILAITATYFIIKK